MAIDLTTKNKFGISYEGTQGILMPKLKYRFRVTFFDFGTDGSGSVELTRNVQSVTRPKITHEEVVIDSYNSRVYVQGKHSWEQISVTFRDDIGHGVARQVSDQLQRQFNHFQQTTPAAGADYKFDMQIEVLDGSTTDPTEIWRLEGCFLTNVDYTDQDYATNDAVQITMQVRYDNATQYDAGENPIASSTTTIGTEA